MWLIVGTVAAIVVAIYFWMDKRVKSHRLANNVIFAAITYEALDENEQSQADQWLEEILEVDHLAGESLADLRKPGREPVLWRWYSIAFAINGVPPKHTDNLGWTPSKNVYRDLFYVARHIPDFEEHLKTRKPYTEYIQWMKR